MKKILFTLEVLLMLSALPLFCGMALGRKHHTTDSVQNISIQVAAKQGAESVVLQSGTSKNS